MMMLVIIFEEILLFYFMSDSNDEHEFLKCILSVKCTYTGAIA